jgi:xanthine/uracil permease
VTEAPQRTAEPRESTAVLAALLVPLIVGTAVAVALGVFARAHEPTSHAIDVPGFSSTLSTKTWLTTVAAILALVQVVTAAAMVGPNRCRGDDPGGCPLRLCDRV